MTNSNSHILGQKIGLVLQDYANATLDLICHQDFRELYPEFLVQVQWMTRSAVPMMKRAIARCREIEDFDSVAKRLIPYLEHHIEEEQDHDDWTLSDLERLGFPRNEVLARLPSPGVASLIGSYYYWIEHHHPLAILSDFAVREGCPPTLETVNYAVEQSGLPREAFHTLEQHAILDQGHNEEFNEFLDSLPLDSHHHELLGVCAFHSIRQCIRLLQDLVPQKNLVVC